MPKQRSRGDANADVETVPVPVVINNETLALTVVELLKDDAILKRIKEVIFPSNLPDAIRPYNPNGKS